MKALIYNVIFCTLLFAAFFGCSKDDASELPSCHGLLLNMSEFSGCGWIIELNDQTIMEPLNLSDFDIALQDSARVVFRYHVADNQHSNCMMGTVVDILDFCYE
jgi:hypothetical protein